MSPEPRAGRWGWRRRAWRVRHSVALVAIFVVTLILGLRSTEGPEETRIPNIVPHKDWEKIARKAVSEAQELMNADTLVLEAETVLARALRRLDEAGPRAVEAARHVRESPVFALVQRRARQYDSVRETLATGTNFRQCWETDDARMWVHAPSGESWFEYRMVARIDFPLRHCLVPLHERDLIIKYQPVFAEPHREIGPQGKHYAVVRTLSQIITFYIETIFELLRVSNYGYGFIIERALSEFNDTDHVHELPERPWWARRVSVDTKNLWLPAGGNQTGTYLLAVCRVQAGIALRQSWVEYLMQSFAPDILRNVRAGAALAMEEGSPWNQRLKHDADGFYKELEKVEQVAARREAVTMHTLPGEEIFDRPWSLGDHDPAPAKKRKRPRWVPR